MSIEAEDAEIRRDMSLLSRKANFTGMFRKLCMDADLHIRGGDRGNADGAGTSRDLR